MTTSAVLLLAGFLAGVALSVALGLPVLRARTAVAELAAERRARADAEQVESRLRASFAQLSAEALDRQSSSGQTAVESAVAPLRVSLGAVDAQLRELESRREAAYAGLVEQVRSLAGTHEQLRAETAGLSSALRAPTVRGRWGEVQLRRVVELAGMVEHCDFVEQPTLEAAGDRSTRARPDLVVRLPGGGCVVVDAKTPLHGYLDAHEAGDEAARTAGLAAHAKALRSHVDALSRKAYWEQVQPSPDLVVLFVPGEPLLSAALEADPGLYEHALACSVLLATPATLIGLLKTVAFGWRSEAMAADAQQVCDLGRELSKRLAGLVGHVDKLGRALDTAVGSYNETVGSLESRVLVSARRLGELGTASEPIAEPRQVERLARHPREPGPQAAAS
jgi:DNA recombination protein RmuC